MPTTVKAADTCPQPQMKAADMPTIYDDARTGVNSNSDPLADDPMGQDFVTVMAAADGRILTKRHTPAGTVDYDKAYLVRSREVPVDTLADLAAALDCSANECVIAGRIRPGIDRQKPHRRTKDVQKDGEQPNYEHAAHRWLLLDVDEKPPRDAVGALVAGAVLTPAKWIDDVPGALRPVLEWLPNELRGAAFIWRLTSSAGMKPGIRIRLGFMLDRAVGELELRAWFAGCPHVDKAAFRPNQPIYCATPIFEGVPDPVQQRSGGVVKGRAAVVAVPADLAGRVKERREHGQEAPEGLVERNDAELIAETDQIIANHIRLHGIGDTPRGEHAYPLANLCADKRNGDSILCLETIAERMQLQGYGEIADDILDRRQEPRGWEQIHPHEYPEPNGTLAEKFGKTWRASKRPSCCATPLCSGWTIRSVTSPRRAGMTAWRERSWCRSRPVPRRARRCWTS